MITNEMELKEVVEDKFEKQVSNLITQNTKGVNKNDT